MHLLVWMVPDDRPDTIEKTDQVISAEIPDALRQPKLHDLVRRFMIHGKCPS
jgi:hypothetical protein